MERYRSTGQSPQRAVAPTKEEDLFSAVKKLELMQWFTTNNIQVTEFHVKTHLITYTEF
jgi:hypothetical protein